MKYVEIVKVIDEMNVVVRDRQEIVSAFTELLSDDKIIQVKDKFRMPYDKGGRDQEEEKVVPKQK